jgi:cell division inhibitor SepF
MNIFRRVWDSIGINDRFDGTEYEYEYGDEDFVPDSPLPEEIVPVRERAIQPASNVIGMPNRTGHSEVVLTQPRSFEEMPKIINMLRERKTVVLNLSLMDPDQAQRCVDFVAGGVYAVDGHQERLGENIFLFTPSVVHITSMNQMQAQIQQAPPRPIIAPTPLSQVDTSFRMQ